MRALYLMMVVMMLLATAMNVEGFYKVPSCERAGGTCRKECEKNEHGSNGYDCSLCCFSHKKA